MKSHIGLYLIYILFATCLCSCHHTASHIEDIRPDVQSKRVVIVYIMGENSLSSYVNDDLEEMRLATKDIPADCKLVVYKDDAQNPVIYTMAHGTDLTVWKQYAQDEVSTDSAQLASTLGMLMRRFPAEHYGLVMWSHGSGWIPSRQRRTIGVDNNHNNGVSDMGTELEISALHNILQGLHLHLDYLLWDACYMQCIEVAYALREDADWLIGSATEIPGYGAPYDEIMRPLFQADIEGVVDKYFNRYEHGGGVNLSAIKTSELEELARQTAPLATQIYAQDAPTEGIQAYGAYTLTTSWRPEYYDMGSTAYQRLSADDYATWVKALEKAVPYRRSTISWATSYRGVYTPTLTDPLHFIGVSTHLPHTKYAARGYDEAFLNTDWAKSVFK